MRGEPKVVFEREEAVGLFDTDARGGIKAFLQSGVADAAFAGR